MAKQRIYGTSYLVALGATAAAILLHLALRGRLGDSVPILALLIAIVAAAWYGGLRGGLLATLLATASAIYFFVDPPWRAIVSPPHTAGVIAFAAVGMLVSFLSESLHQAMRRYEAERSTLREREERFALALKHSNTGAWDYDLLAGRAVGSETLHEIAGLPPEETLTLERVFELIHPLDRDSVLTAVKPMVESAGEVKLEFRIRSPRQGERWIFVAGKGIAKDGGCVERLTGIARDITQQKRAQEALRESEQRFSRFTQHLPGLAWIKDADGRYVYANAAAASAFGTPLDDLYGKTDDDLFPAPTAAALKMNDRRALESSAGVQATETLAFQGGAIHTSLVSKFPIPGPDGRSLLIGGVAIDITEQKRAEEALRVAQEQLQLIADTMEAPVSRCSRDYRYLWVNKPYAKWVGRPAEEIIGRPIVEVLGPEAFGHLKPHFDRVLSGQRVQYEDLVSFQAQGRRWINATYSPTFDAAGQPDGWVAIVIDVHERKQLEEALRDADRRKDAFLATLAHELRNPLAPIRCSLAILHAKTPPDPELTWSRDVIDRQVRQMVRLLDDLLDVSRISRNKLELRTERVAFSDVVASAVETSRPLIDASRHELVLVMPPEPIHLDADPIRLAQVLANLLNNAAKYTSPGGRIELLAEQHGSEVVVTVADNGMGIAAESFPHLFEMFSQAAPALARSQGGLGIGLSLAKGLVELHGGSLEARSEGLGKGSQFILRLPGAHPAIPPPSPAPYRGNGGVVAQAKRRVLVVDDNRDAADSLARMLRIMGHDVHLAYDGEQAVQAAGQLLPDLIFLDIGMPKLNGYEAAQRIRDESWGRQMVLVALTGWGREEDRRASNGAGFNFHLVKPAEATAIARLMAGIPGNGVPHEPDSPPAALASNSHRP